MAASEAIVWADVLLKSAAGRSILAAGTEVTPENAAQFLASGEIREKAAAILQKLGFQIENSAPTGITISGARALFETVFRVKLVEKSSPVFQPATTALHSYYEAATTPQLPPDLAVYAVGVSFPRPFVLL